MSERTLPISIRVPAIIMKRITAIAEAYSAPVDEQPVAVDPEVAALLGVLLLFRLHLYKSLRQ